MAHADIGASAPANRQWPADDVRGQIPPAPRWQGTASEPGGVGMAATRFGSDEEAVTWATQHMPSDGLAPHHERAVQEYTSSSFDWMKSGLREGKVPPESRDDFVRLIPQLDQAIAHSHLPSALNLHWGVNDDVVRQLVAAVAPGHRGPLTPEIAERLAGTTFTNLSYTSTSIGTHSAVVRDAYVMLRVPEGHPGLNVMRVSEYGLDEREITLPREMKAVIHGVYQRRIDLPNGFGTDDIWFIEAEVVPADWEPAPDWRPSPLGDADRGYPRPTGQPNMSAGFGPTTGMTGPYVPWTGTYDVNLAVTDPAPGTGGGTPPDSDGRDATTPAPRQGGGTATGPESTGTGRGGRSIEDALTEVARAQTEVVRFETELENTRERLNLAEDDPSYLGGKVEAAQRRVTAAQAETDLAQARLDDARGSRTGTELARGDMDRARTELDRAHADLAQARESYTRAGGTTASDGTPQQALRSGFSTDAPPSTGTTPVSTRDASPLDGFRDLPGPIPDLEPPEVWALFETTTNAADGSPVPQVSEDTAPPPADTPSPENTDADEDPHAPVIRDFAVTAAEQPPPPEPVRQRQAEAAEALTAYSGLRQRVQDALTELEKAEARVKESQDAVTSSTSKHEKAEKAEKQARTDRTTAVDSARDRVTEAERRAAESDQRATESRERARQSARDGAAAEQAHRAAVRDAGGIRASADAAHRAALDRAAEIRAAADRSDDPAAENARADALVHQADQDRDAELARADRVEREAGEALRDARERHARNVRRLEDDVRTAARDHGTARHERHVRAETTSTHDRAVHKAEEDLRKARDVRERDERNLLRDQYDLAVAGRTYGDLLRDTADAGRRLVEARSSLRDALADHYRATAEEARQARDTAEGERDRAVGERDALLREQAGLPAVIDRAVRDGDRAAEAAARDRSAALPEEISAAEQRVRDTQTEYERRTGDWERATADVRDGERNAAQEHAEDQQRSASFGEFRTEGRELSEEAGDTIRKLQARVDEITGVPGKSREDDLGTYSRQLDHLLGSELLEPHRVRLNVTHGDRTGFDAVLHQLPDLDDAARTRLAEDYAKNPYPSYSHSGHAVRIGDRTYKLRLRSTGNDWRRAGDPRAKPDDTAPDPYSSDSTTRDSKHTDARGTNTRRNVGGSVTINPMFVSDPIGRAGPAIVPMLQFALNQPSASETVNRSVSGKTETGLLGKPVDYSTSLTAELTVDPAPIIRYTAEGERIPLHRATAFQQDDALTMTVELADRTVSEAPEEITLHDPFAPRPAGEEPTGNPVGPRAASTHGAAVNGIRHTGLDDRSLTDWVVAYVNQRRPRTLWQRFKDATLPNLLRHYKSDPKNADSIREALSDDSIRDMLPDLTRGPVPLIVTDNSGREHLAKMWSVPEKFSRFDDNPAKLDLDRKTETGKEVDASLQRSATFSSGLGFGSVLQILGSLLRIEAPMVDYRHDRERTLGNSRSSGGTSNALTKTGDTAIYDVRRNYYVQFEGEDFAHQFTGNTVEVLAVDDAQILADPHRNDADARSRADHAPVYPHLRRDRPDHLGGTTIRGITWADGNRYASRAPDTASEASRSGDDAATTPDTDAPRPETDATRPDTSDTDTAESSPDPVFTVPHPLPQTVFDAYAQQVLDGLARKYPGLVVPEMARSREDYALRPGEERDGSFFSRENHFRRNHPVAIYNTARVLETITEHNLTGRGQTSDWFNEGVDLHLYETALVNPDLSNFNPWNPDKEGWFLPDIVTVRLRATPHDREFGGTVTKNRTADSGAGTSGRQRSEEHERSHALGLRVRAMFRDVDNRDTRLMPRLQAGGRPRHLPAAGRAGPQPLRRPPRRPDDRRQRPAGAHHRPDGTGGARPARRGGPGAASGERRQRARTRHLHPAGAGRGPADDRRRPAGRADADTAGGRARPDPHLHLEHQRGDRGPHPASARLRAPRGRRRTAALPQAGGRPRLLPDLHVGRDAGRQFRPAVLHLPRAPDTQLAARLVPQRPAHRRAVRRPHRRALPRPAAVLHPEVDDAAGDQHQPQRGHVEERDLRRRHARRRQPEPERRRRARRPGAERPRPRAAARQRLKQPQHPGGMEPVQPEPRDERRHVGVRDLHGEDELQAARRGAHLQLRRPADRGRRDPPRLRLHGERPAPCQGQAPPRLPAHHRQRGVRVRPPGRPVRGRPRQRPVPLPRDGRRRRGDDRGRRRGRRPDRAAAQPEPASRAVHGPAGLRGPRPAPDQRPPDAALRGQRGPGRRAARRAAEAGQLRTDR
ncbi:ADP-ribosyltransferase [Marinitenerispora sediminis]|uniref:ADP-ribosyltransferase n=1 Tax=Marinitenerispora sediminis TaxID=1931232 RepID=UPI001C697CB0|nr:ADP-ribosyltransferase [Marinitenerispora sediminis]